MSIKLTQDQLKDAVSGLCTEELLSILSNEQLVELTIRIMRGGLTRRENAKLDAYKGDNMLGHMMQKLAECLMGGDKQLG